MSKKRALTLAIGASLVAVAVAGFAMVHWAAPKTPALVNNAVHQLEQAKLGIAAGKDALELGKKTMAAEQRKYEL
jgi:hypothetical protein